MIANGKTYIYKLINEDQNWKKKKTMHYQLELKGIIKNNNFFIKELRKKN